MPMPQLTADDRADALAKALRNRKARKLVKENLKLGVCTVAEVIKDAETSQVTANMRVTDMLEAMPGVGKVKAAQIMERLGISESRRVGGLGPRQKAALKREFPTD